jgi:hypothetical protein
VVRSVLARSVLAALGRGAIAATGALGISSLIWLTVGRTRRMATSIPPALTFNDVANSRNSLPFRSRLRTKTGIASGNLVHFRRSCADRPPFIADLSIAPLPRVVNKHMMGQLSAERPMKDSCRPMIAHRSPPKITVKPCNSRSYILLTFASMIWQDRGLLIPEVQGFATLG